MKALKYKFDLEGSENGGSVNSPREGLVTEPKSSLDKRWAIAIIVVVVVVAVAVTIGLAIHFSNRSEDSSAQGQVDGENNASSTHAPSTHGPSTHGPSTSAPSTHVPSTPVPSTPAQSTPATKPSDWLEASCDISADDRCSGSSRRLLLISLDGFRADYLQRNVTPVINKLSQCGVHAPYIRSIFPTMTFPNHYTIVTGLYPESHGIVGNTMYDEKIGELFKLSSDTKMDPAWWKGEPIWITAKKQGKKTAAYFWVGSDVNISGTYPDEWYPYDGRVSYDTRINRVLNWTGASDPDDPDLMLTYFNEPDHEAHDVGPSSDKLDDKLREVDDYIGTLMNGLYSKGLDKCVNIIIVADHGMTSTSCTREINFSHLTNTKRFLTQKGTYGHIDTRFMKNLTKYETEQSVSSVVDDLECKSRRMKVFTKETAPKRHHVLNSNRIGNILLEVEDRWLLRDDKGSSCFLSGNHGYDNIYKSMESLFLAYGPAFKQNLTTHSFENIELYNLMCDVLGIESAPNNGTKGSLYHLLQNPPQSPTQPDTGADNCVPDNRTLQPSCMCENQTWNDGIALLSNMSPPLQHPVPVATLSRDSCLLDNADYDVLYSHSHNMPLWIAFNLNINNSRLIDSNVSVVARCVKDDERIEIPTSVIWCGNTSTNFTKSYFFQPAFATTAQGFDESYFSSNIAVMKPGFAEEVHHFLQRLQLDYSSLYGSLSVVTGPVWDRDGDGRADRLDNQTQYYDDTNMIPIPTHYYIILMKCANTTKLSCDQGGIDIVSFVLPHVNTIPNCLAPLDYLKDNVVRVRDIELLTGLQFFTDVESTLAAQLRTFLPVTIWPTTLEPKVVRWLDLPCEIPTNAQCPGNSRPLLLISLDGFRADYLQRNVTPVINRLSQCGVHAPYIRSIFPTMTFPNHYTIVTGLYPESHGIVGNTMYDEKIGELFKLSSDTKMDPAWWKGEPIWITAKKQGKNTAAFFWVGTDVNISGIYPDEWHLYDGRVTYDTRIDRVLKWVSTSEPNKPDLMLTYFDEPDHEGHGQGPDHHKIDETLRSVDEHIERMMNGLATRGLHHCVNIIILADHGMTDTSRDREVDYSDFTDTNRFLTQGGTYGHIDTHFMSNYTKYTTEQSVSSVVKDLKCQSERMKVFTKETVPKRHHVLNSNRIGNILLEIEDRWQIRDGKKRSSSLKGNHGYDNIYKSMEAMFLAYGPDFKQNLQVKAFENIELYNLMCNVLGIEPAPNNGTRGSLNHLLQNPPQPAVQSTATADNCTSSNRSLQAPCMCNDQVSLGVAVGVSAVHPIQQVPIPVSAVSNSSCSLDNTDFSLLYSSEHNTPLTASFILSLNNPREITIQNISDARGCVRDDSMSKVNTSAIWCQQQSGEFSPGYLFEPYFASSAQSLTAANQITNIVPMYKGFQGGVWNFVQRLQLDYSSLYGSLSVVTGPLWDRDVDGHADRLDNQTQYLDDSLLIPIPTHYYIILMKCANNTMLSCDQGGIDIVSFVLPHVNTIPNCLLPLDYLKDNVVRVRDIELLTGLQFFTDIESTLAAQLRTFLPVTIWPTTLESIKLSWQDLPCSETLDSQCPTGTPPLILIGLDGFGADFVKRNITPVIQRLSQCGVHSPFMRPVYPTLTFPNMYSIVTGLYPESHGIVANTMYDKALDTRFTIRTSGKSDPSWWGGEPIWNSAIKQGKTAASYFWTGSDIRIQGMLPNISFPYDGKVPYEQRVSTVLRWLDLPNDERPDFITLYFDKPDYTIHREGTDSAETNEALELVDSMVGRLMDGLVKRNLHTCVNVIVVADHGLVNTSCDRQVRLNAYLNETELGNVYVFDGPDAQLATSYHYSSRRIRLKNPPASKEEYLGKLQCQQPHMRAIDKTMSPVRNHYINNPRIPEILLQSDPGWLVARKHYRTCSGANHGWDNMFTHLGSIFVAHGPSFKTQLEIEPFENIELYNLMAELLDITPAPNNGTTGSLRHILKSTTALPQFVSVTSPSVCTPGNANNRTRPSNCTCYNNQADTQLLQNLLTVNTSLSDEVIYGVPQVVGSKSICHLKHNRYTTGFNAELYYPSWTMFFPVTHMLPPGNVAGESECVLDDPRSPLPDHVTCQSTTGNPALTSLIPQDFLGNYSRLSTNAVLMYDGFRTGIWWTILSMVQKWTDFPSQVTVTVGPIFDNNHDGLADTSQQIRNMTESKGGELPLATHFYLSLMRCNQSVNNNCQTNSVLSFVLPHRDQMPACWDHKKYLLDNVVRIRDIELLTGLQFLTQGISPQSALQLRLHLPIELWSTR